MDVFRVRYVKDKGYKLLDLNKVYTVSCLSYSKISFITISGSFSSTNFKTLEGEKLPFIYKRYNEFDEDLFLKHGYVLCMDDTVQYQLKIGEVYKGVNIYLRGFETGKITLENIDGFFYKSRFRTLTEDEVLKYLRLTKLDNIFK